MSPEVLLEGRADRSGSEPSSPTGTGFWRRLTVSLLKEYFRLRLARHGLPGFRGRYLSEIHTEPPMSSLYFPSPPCPINRPSVPPDAPPNPKPCRLVVELSFCHLRQIAVSCRVASIFSGSTSTQTPDSSESYIMPLNPLLKIPLP